MRPGSAGSPCGANCPSPWSHQPPAATVQQPIRCSSNAPEEGKGNREAVEELNSDLHSKTVLRPHSLHRAEGKHFLSSASQEDSSPGGQARLAAPRGPSGNRARRRPAPAEASPPSCSLTCSLRKGTRLRSGSWAGSISGAG